MGEEKVSVYATFNPLKRRTASGVVGFHEDLYRTRLIYSLN